ncbi:HAMP domain-containing histidine kinase [Streptomyces sp. RY43-2]|uniref:histidine kinase n=1 Tax=Streptomyces macrolidinus TaxID=2952607 RepID=A0ABT0ZBU2_9ACTN|nr:HAMP domain-containing sensor histidine kinase [Streptomyces macrolidinus]MCN9241255.1 HAMP domain-containing histidine kinase [Streptomyces macrolidinus]
MSSLRTTFTVSFAAVAAGVTVLVGFLSYDAAARLVRVDQQTVFVQVVADLRDQVGRKPLTPQDFAVSDRGHGSPREEIIRPSRTVVQVLGPGGAVVGHSKTVLPVRAEDRRIAAAVRSGELVEHRSVDVGGVVYRVATVGLGQGRGAVQVAQELSGTEDLLRSLQRRTALLMGAVVVAAGLFGWWLARRITGRLVRLADAAEGVARTRRLGVQVSVTGNDEVARLGRSFDRMLGRLAQSEEDQRRLVQDAGHELRTPLTSLRTNISLLRRIDELPPAAREELVADLAQESRELTDLVNELVDLAAGQCDTEPVQRLTLADVAEDAAVIARRRLGREIVVRVTGDTTVDGRASALQRAVSNLLENAAKFDREGTAPIEVVVTGPGQPPPWSESWPEPRSLPRQAASGQSAFGARDSGRYAAGDTAGGMDGAVDGAVNGRGALPATALKDGGEAPGTGSLPGSVRVEVLDRGPGIEEGDLLRIFDRFYRAADARSLPGSGLGLSIVREVATSHGGASFACRREGGGSVIGFTAGGGRRPGSE